MVAARIKQSATARNALTPGVTWWGWHVPALLEVLMVFLLGMGLLGIAIWEFSAGE
jgi:ABC-2 type transport system permease protein